MTDPSDPRAEGLGEAASIIARGLRRSALAPIWLACAAICIDVPIFAVALWFAQYAAIPGDAFAPLDAALDALLLALVASLTLAAMSSYNPKALRSAPRSMVRAFAAFALPAAIASFAMPAETLREVLPAASLALAAVVVPSRIGGAVVAQWMLDTRLFDRRAVIAGGGEPAMHLIRGLARRPAHIQLHGIFDDRDDIRSPIQVLGVPKIGGYDDLVSFVRLSGIDLVIIALPLDAEARIDWLLTLFRVLPVEIRLSNYSADFRFAHPDRDPLIAALRRAFTPERRLAKRLFDIAFASLALLLVMPVMVLAALAIRLDSPGPIFFRQRRHGYNDQIIEVLKFRSMHAADADPDAQRVVTRGDARVTRVGRILRRSSIDELPQLLNVLKGDLSLVGPRPHAVDAVSSRQERFSRIIDGYSARHRLPPGITGWAQVNGWRGEIDDPVKLRARFDHDLYYIENWSIWLDLKILFRTPFSLLDSRGAY